MSIIVVRDDSNVTVTSGTKNINIQGVGVQGPPGPGAVFVQDDTPEVLQGIAYMWVQTGLGESGEDFTLWFGTG